MFEHSKVFTSFAVDDVSEAQEFYGETLGLRHTAQDGVLLLHLADGHSVLVYPKPGHIPASYTVLNFEVDDIEDAADALAGRGVHFLQYEEYGTDDRGIVRGPDRDIAWFSDPAGNIHSAFHPRTPMPGDGG